eukprot:jgi/Undpi1/12769/HiC_scaffold_6.g02437.m1
MATSGIQQRQQQRQQQQQQSDGMAYQHNDTTTCRATPIHAEVFAEIATSGARAPIHFVEECASFRGRSRSAQGPSTSRWQPEVWRDNGNRGVQSSPSPSSSSSSSSPPSSSSPSPPAEIVHQAVIGEHQSSSSIKSVSCNGSGRSAKHHRRTSTPLDGAYLTLLGVSTGLKTPGVDHWAVAGALVESSVDLRTRNAKGMTPLHLACAAGQVDVAKVLMLAGADSHARDHRSRCPLHMAALSGSAQLVDALLAYGADPNKASDLGTTALHNAALLGRVPVSRALLVAGANPDASDHNSFSPLYLAAQNGHTQVVLDLLAGGADPEIKTTRGFTPLHVAARCGRLTVLRALLDAGVPVDCSSSPAETTPLHLSAGFSRESCVHELLKRNANPTKVNKRGATPLTMVGTLTAPLQADASKSRTKISAEKKLSQERNVRAALTRAHNWQRRRGAVLAAEVLRREAFNSASTRGEGGVAVAVARAEGAAARGGGGSKQEEVQASRGC